MNNQRTYLTGILLVAVCIDAPSEALARGSYLIAFQKQYKHIPEMDKESGKIGGAHCAICHPPGDKYHKKLNDYGAAVGARITREDFMRLRDDPEAVYKKAHGALEKAEYDKSPSGELYGERIRKGVLPASGK